MRSYQSSTFDRVAVIPLRPPKVLLCEAARSHGRSLSLPCWPGDLEIIVNELLYDRFVTRTIRILPYLKLNLSILHIYSVPNRGVGLVQAGMILVEDWIVNASMAVLLM